MDDILIVWEGSDREFEELVIEINGREKGLIFQEEIGGNRINYIDLDIKIEEGKYKYDIYRKKTYTDLIIPNESFHPIGHKFAALRSYCYRAINYLEDEESRTIELKRIKQIAKRNNYNTKIIDKIVRDIENRKEERKEESKYLGSITYSGYQTKKILECFEKYDIHVAIKKNKSIFDIICNKKTEEIPMLQKSGVYKLNCGNCGKVYVGESGRKLEVRLKEHARGEGDRTTNSLFARHFMDTGHSFVNPMNNVEILKIEKDMGKRKLMEELEILKIKKENKEKLMNIQTDFNNDEIFFHVLRK